MRDPADPTDAALADLALQVILDWDLGLAPNPQRCEITGTTWQIAQLVPTVLARSPYATQLLNSETAATAGSAPEGANP